MRLEYGNAARLSIVPAAICGGLATALTLAGACAFGPAGLRTMYFGYLPATFWTHQPVGSICWMTALVLWIACGFCWIARSADSGNGLPVFRPRARHTGFTLIELMVVICIAVLLLGMAAVTFRTLTGSRSTEAATNIVSAMVARARTDAIGAQDYRGVMFYLDQGTGRVGMVELKAVPSQPNFSAAPAAFLAWGLQNANVWLDLADTEPVLLPVGVGTHVVAGSSVGTRYVGFASSFPFSGTPYTNRPGGCIMFDGNGRLALGQAGMVWMDNTGAMTPLGRLIFGNGAFSLASFSGVPASSWGTPQLALSVFDGTSFEEYCRAQGMTDPWMNGINPDGSLTAAEVAKETWLDTNTTQFLVNRYNGTLVKAE